jgi:hypothetical protein
MSRCKLNNRSEQYLIQDDSGGKVNIFGGVSIGHCKTKISYQHVSNSEWLTS